MLLTDVINSQGKVLDAIKMFESHPSIICIKKHVKIENWFHFSPIEINDIHSEFMFLDTRKAFPSTNIPPKQLKEVVDIVAEPLQKIWNEEILTKHTFPSKNS